MQVAFDHFKALDERINFVATKVVHLGDQLEGVNTPRTRAVEAQLLMKYFSEFMEDNRTLSHIFTDPFQVCIAMCINSINLAVLLAIALTDDNVATLVLCTTGCTSITAKSDNKHDVKLQIKVQFYAPDFRLRALLMVASVS